MFRTFTLAAVTLAAATSFASAGGVAKDIFIELAKQDDDRAAVAALTKGDVAPGGSQEIFIALAAQDDDRAAIRALERHNSAGTVFTTKGAGVSPLEVALRHAIEDDNRALAAHIAQKLGR